MGDMDKFLGTDAPADSEEKVVDGAKVDFQPTDADGDPPEWLQPAQAEAAPEVDADETPETEPAEGENEGESPAPELPPRDERGRFAKTDDPSSTHQVPLEAMLHERERRQKAERELEELRASKPKEEDETPADFFDEPDKAVSQAVRREMAKQRETLLSEATQHARNLFFNHAENLARSRHDDYDAMRDKFIAEVQKNPALARQLSEANDPGEFVYSQGKMLQELGEVGGNLAAYRAKVEAEIRASIKAERAEKAQRVASVPQSLNTEPSRGAGVEGGQWSGPTPLTDILPTKME